ncbi:sensor domain-containing protein [Pectinatus sottacetonis]|uniref:sensor domain-containing protein n=1 Tax=Pectinatus sottacetonis TaxID=1002795 RepID=UPI0018C65317|nr:diguanylate cyclase [Pectinatus sottacetonis]
MSNNIKIDYSQPNKFFCFRSIIIQHNAIVKASFDIIIDDDELGMIISWNDKSSRIYGYTAKEIIGKSIFTLFPNDKKEDVRQVIEKIQAGKKIDNYEIVQIDRKGKTLNTLIKIFPVTDMEEIINYKIEIIKDIACKLKFKKALDKKIETLRTSFIKLNAAEQIFENANDGFVITDKNKIIQMINPAFINVTGYTAKDVTGISIEILKSDRHKKCFYENIQRLLESDGYWTGEIWVKKKNQGEYLSWTSVNPICDSEGKVKMYAYMICDLTERFNYEEKLKYQALHDILTGLPNRRCFYFKLRTIIADLKNTANMMAVFFLDLDNFKKVNDTLGHNMGDALLKIIAKRLKDNLYSTDLIARMGGDEFTIILNNIVKHEDVVKVADKIIRIVSQPLVLEGHIINVATSIGISRYPQDGKTVQMLLKKADVAMYAAKNSGNNKYCFYSN